jgi:hypothetical protein
MYRHHGVICAVGHTGAAPAWWFLGLVEGVTVAKQAAFARQGAAVTSHGTLLKGKRASLLLSNKLDEECYCPAHTRNIHMWPLQPGVCHSHDGPIPPDVALHVDHAAQGLCKETAPQQLRQRGGAGGAAGLAARTHVIGQASSGHREGPRALQA